MLGKHDNWRLISSQNLVFSFQHYEINYVNTNINIFMKQEIQIQCTLVDSSLASITKILMVETVWK